MSRVKYDWLKIDFEYITGDMSLHEMADEKGIPFHTLAAHARKAKYAEKRTEYKQLVLSKLRKEMSKHDADAISDIMTATEKAIKLVGLYIADDATLHNYVIGQKEIRLDKMDTKALRNMSGTIRDLVCVLKILNPDTTENTDQPQGVIIMPEIEDE